MEKDAIFETAERYVKFTGKSVFLTGRAGTGKTTFLKYVTETISKRFVVLAPTGVAAINAGGTTIHSFFQLPLCPYLPDVKELITEYQTPEKYRSLRKERIRIIRTLDLLIIDEISMVRADLLDAVDMSLRRYRRNDRPFGGVQLLMIGDIHQLSPVVKDSERQYISQVYPSPYFFHSKALQKLDYITIELQKVHRQKDAEFISILNAVRENRITNDILRSLNARVGAPKDSEDVIRLTTHNAQADHVNSSKLAELPGEPVTFEAMIDGEFPANSYPAEEFLTLKKGAKVMFIRNDSEGRFYNGKIGMITDISPKGIVTVEDFEGQTIDVEPVDWENIQYTIDDTTSKILPNMVGKFRQIPLRVAWAVTIHKSQGLTFDNVIIDAGAAFAFGQVYVALSRCRTLEGISLESPIGISSLYQDCHVSQFNDTRAPLEAVQASLGLEEERHKFNIYRELFTFEETIKSLNWYIKNWKGSLDSLYPAEYLALTGCRDKFIGLKDTGDTFCRQLTRLEVTKAEESYLNERLVKAAEYFFPSLEEIRTFCLKVSDLEIDNKETRKRIKEAGDEVMILLDILCRSMQALQEGRFSIETYGKIRTECQLEDRSSAKRKNTKKLIKVEGGTPTVNEELRERLQEWRTERFKADNVPAYQIMLQSTLLEIAALIPKTLDELMSIKGFGKVKCQKYGDQILKITSEF